ncbi:hypothetical protein Nepgr_007925 [Nepenthes gracilis]|uniref:Uncharacterized protein n=1 Tax=Nepenthes gracilis TaxID=150966 RepID=A0AAD3S7S0_NEPGR|nr:hypothetical protein Nepgr_007925 [Nepenthes gracilis]
MCNNSSKRSSSRKFGSKTDKEKLNRQLLLARKDLPTRQGAIPRNLTTGGALDERGCLSSKATLAADSSHLLKAENSGLDIENPDVNPEPIEVPSVEACISSGVDPEDLDVLELQCGPPVQQTCNATGSIPGTASENKPFEQNVSNSNVEILVNLEPGDDGHAVPST